MSQMDRGLRMLVCEQGHGPIGPDGELLVCDCCCELAAFAIEEEGLIGFQSSTDLYVIVRVPGGARRHPRPVYVSAVGVTDGAPDWAPF